MIAMKARRIVGGCFVLFATIICLLGYVVADSALCPVDYYSGWSLLAIILVLALLNARKKLLAVPLGSAVMWLGVHVYLGVVSVVVFLFHVKWSAPDGPLEATLAVIFLLVAGTGFAGLLLSRVLAVRLSRRGDEVIFERIPGFTNGLRRRAQRLVFESVKTGASVTIADFYQLRLARYFSRPRYVVGYLFGLTSASHALLSELGSLNRYLSESERPIRQELERVIQQKDELDFQYTLQATLKYWLFVHIPLTYSLLLFVPLHVLVVYAFSGELP